MKTKQKKVVSKLETARNEAAKLTAAEQVKPIETVQVETVQVETVQVETAKIAFSDCKFLLETVNSRINSYQSKAGRIRQIIMAYAEREMQQAGSKTRLVIAYDGASSPLLDAALIGRMAKSGALPVKDPQGFLAECRAVVALKKALQTLTA